MNISTLIWKYRKGRLNHSVIERWRDPSGGEQILESIGIYLSLKLPILNRIGFLVLSSAIIYLALTTGNAFFAFSSIAIATVDILDLARLAGKALRLRRRLQLFCDDYGGLARYKFFVYIPPYIHWQVVQHRASELLLELYRTKDSRLEEAFKAFDKFRLISKKSQAIMRKAPR